jgi:hypothetical protein
MLERCHVDLSIKVAKDGWDAVPANVTAVLLSVAKCFEEAILERDVEPILVMLTPSPSDPPKTGVEHTENGEVPIWLSVRGPSWAPLAFEFAHEFCHVLSNPTLKSHPSCAWLYESICETSSLFALRAMGASWQISPPYPNWAPCASSFVRLYEDRCKEPGHQLPAGATFPQWLGTNLPFLQNDCTRRADEVVVARRLLPVFEENVDAWRAVRYLKLWDASNDSSVEQLFAHWRDTIPPALCSAVDLIEHRLTRE